MTREELTEAKRQIASTSPPMRIVILSDTHGLLRPEALAALEGADAIVHGAPCALQRRGIASVFKGGSKEPPFFVLKRARNLAINEEKLRRPK